MNKDLVFTAQDGGPINLYFVWHFFMLLSRLIIEIIKSNISVAKVVLSPKMPIKPHFIKIPLKPKKDFNKMLYANVINLTPGTLTIDITEDSYIIHALNEEFAEKIEDFSLEDRVLKLEDD